MAEFYLGFIVYWAKTGLFRTVASWLVHASDPNLWRDWNLREIFTPPFHRQQAKTHPRAMAFSSAPREWVANQELNAEFLSCAFSHKTLLAHGLPWRTSSRKQRHSGLLKQAWISWNLFSVRYCCLWGGRHFNLEKKWTRGNTTEVYAVMSGMERVTKERLLNVSSITRPSWEVVHSKQTHESIFHKMCSSCVTPYHRKLQA